MAARQWVGTNSNGFQIGIRWDSSQPRRCQLGARNTGIVSIFAQIQLTDGRTFGRVFAPGEDAVTTLPINTVEFAGLDAEGEPFFAGIARITAVTV